MPKASREKLFYPFLDGYRKTTVHMTTRHWQQHEENVAMHEIGDVTIAGFKKCQGSFPVWKNILTGYEEYYIIILFRSNLVIFYLKMIFRNTCRS